MENGKPADIEYVHKQTKMALEYMRGLRADAIEKTRMTTAI